MPVDRTDRAVIEDVAAALRSRAVQDTYAGLALPVYRQPEDGPENAAHRTLYGSLRAD